MDNKITIGFRFTNEFGDDFSSDSTVSVYSDLGETELDTIMGAFNQFLRQIGYIRRNDLIFAKDLTEEEYDAVSNFLDDYREGRNE